MKRLIDAIVMLLFGLIGGFLGMWTYDSFSTSAEEDLANSFATKYNNSQQELEQTKSIMKGYKNTFETLGKYEIYLKEKK